MLLCCEGDEILIFGSAYLVPTRNKIFFLSFHFSLCTQSHTPPHTYTMTSCNVIDLDQETGLANYYFPSESKNQNLFLLASAALMDITEDSEPTPSIVSFYGYNDKANNNQPHRNNVLSRNNIKLISTSINKDPIRKPVIGIHVRIYI